MLFSNWQLLKAENIYEREKKKKEENLGVKLNKIITHNCKNISDNTNNI